LCRCTDSDLHERLTSGRLGRTGAACGPADLPCQRTVHCRVRPRAVGRFRRRSAIAGIAVSVRAAWGFGDTGSGQRGVGWQQPTCWPARRAAEQERGAHVMTTAPSSRFDPPPERVPLRVRLTDSMSNGRLGGAWWPQSRDLCVEVADLVDNFPDPTARITRVLFSRSDWVNAVHDGRPVRQLRAHQGLVNVGSVARGAPGRWC
jgi:hypothetical protein